MPRIHIKTVKTLTKAQQIALKHVYDRGPIDGGISYKDFRRRVLFSFDYAMVPWHKMWLGIEQDGYTHS